MTKAQEIIVGILSGIGTVTFPGILTIILILITLSWVYLSLTFFVVVSLIILLVVFTITFITCKEKLFRGVYTASTIITLILVYSFLRLLLTPIYSV